MIDTRPIPPQLDPWRSCVCGHFWLQHDVEEYRGDGSETCCVEGCDQAQCPGKVSRAAAGELQ